MNLRLRGRVIGLVLLLLVLNGCSRSLEPLELTYGYVGANRKIARAAGIFRSNVLPLSNNQDVDPKEVRNHYEKLRTAVQEAKETTQNFHLPVSKKARQLRLEYQHFLKVQEEFLNDEFPLILKTVEDNNLSNTDKWTKIEGIFQQIGKKEKTELESLNKVYTTYCYANMIKPGAKVASPPNSQMPPRGAPPGRQ